jgi:hypothetical protein
MNAICVNWVDEDLFMPSSSALIPMSICPLQCLFSHSFTTYEWLNRDCDVQINIGIMSRWTGYRFDQTWSNTWLDMYMLTSLVLNIFQSCYIQLKRSFSEIPTRFLTPYREFEQRPHTPQWRQLDSNSRYGVRKYSRVTSTLVVFKVFSCCEDWTSTSCWETC